MGFFDQFQSHAEQVYNTPPHEHKSHLSHELIAGAGKSNNTHGSPLANFGGTL